MTVTLLIVLCTVAVVGIAAWWLNSQSPSLPPGPRGLPILGNALQLPKDFHEHIFTQWRAKYGELLLLVVVHDSVLTRES